MLVRFSKEEAIVRDLVYFNDAEVVGTEKPEPFTCVEGRIRAYCAPMAHEYSRRRLKRARYNGHSRR